MISTPYMYTLLSTFPKVIGKNEAVTGNIPIDYFNENEEEIRREMRYQGLRAFYRGGRKSNDSHYPTHTRRCDATSVLLYRK